MKTEFLRQFDKDLDSIDVQTVRSKLLKVIGNIDIADNIDNIENLKKLKGYKNCYRIRIGDYRIGLFIDSNTVEFVRIIHRKDIYRIFP